MAERKPDDPTTVKQFLFNNLKNVRVEILEATRDAVDKFTIDSGEAAAYTTLWAEVSIAGNVVGIVSCCLFPIAPAAAIVGGIGNAISALATYKSSIAKPETPKQDFLQSVKGSIVGVLNNAISATKNNQPPAITVLRRESQKLYDRYRSTPKYAYGLTHNDGDENRMKLIFELIVDSRRAQAATLYNDVFTHSTEALTSLFKIVQELMPDYKAALNQMMANLPRHDVTTWRQSSNAKVGAYPTSSTVIDDPKRMAELQSIDFFMKWLTLGGGRQKYQNWRTQNHIGDIPGL